MSFQKKSKRDLIYSFKNKIRLSQFLKVEPVIRVFDSKAQEELIEQLNKAGTQYVLFSIPFTYQAFSRKTIIKIPEELCVKPSMNSDVLKCLGFQTGKTLKGGRIHIRKLHFSYWHL